MNSPVLSALRNHKIKDRQQDAADIVRRFPKYQPKTTGAASAFLEYCEKRSIVGLPATPLTVAEFVKAQDAAGFMFSSILESLAGIEALHDLQWANPVATGIVGAALEEIAPSEAIKAPRSWGKQEKVTFYQLPLWTQATVARRETQRDAAFMRAMNEFAEAKKLSSSTDALLPDSAPVSERQTPSGPTTEQAHTQSGAHS